MWTIFGLFSLNTISSTEEKKRFSKIVQCVETIVWYNIMRIADVWISRKTHKFGIKWNLNYKLVENNYQSYVYKYENLYL